MRSFAVFLWCLYLQLEDILAAEAKCHRNEIFGDREGNVYYCPNPTTEYTECCEKDQEFTCCEKDSEKNLTEQIQLWGLVAAVVVLMIIIGICVKKDIICCKGERWIFYKYTKKGKQEKDKPFVGIEETDPGYEPNYKHNSGFIYDEKVTTRH